MYENRESFTEPLVERVRKLENKKERAWDQMFLAENLFHEDHEAAVLAMNPNHHIRLAVLESEFLSAKKDLVNGKAKNMGQIFEVAIQERFLGKIHVVELGRTENPGLNGEVDGLKTEYNDFKQWMINEHHIERDLSREESGRDVSARQTELEEARDTLAIVVRNRPLIKTSLDVRGQLVDVEVAKRMVFSAPLKTIAQIYASNGGDLNDEKALRAVENLMDYTRDAIHPISTSYHLKTSLFSKKLK